MSVLLPKQKDSMAIDFPFSRTCLQATCVTVLMGMRETIVMTKSMSVSPTHATMLVSAR